MARIKTYQQDFNVTDSDKLLGSDGTGATRNYTAKTIADYLNNFSKIGVGGQVAYRFSSSISPRQAGTLTFALGSGDNTAFSSISSIYASKYNTDNKVISDLLLYYVGKSIFIFQLDDPNNFAEYILDSADVVESNFFDLSMQFVSGNGVIKNNSYYGLLISANTSSDKTYRHIQGVSSDTWVINHNLNKYPSVTIQDSAGSIVIGELTYNNKNTITLTFSGAFSGEAHLN